MYDEVVPEPENVEDSSDSNTDNGGNDEEISSPIESGSEEHSDGNSEEATDEATEGGLISWLTHTFRNAAVAYAADIKDSKTTDEEASVELISDVEWILEPEYNYGVEEFSADEEGEIYLFTPVLLIPDTYYVEDELPIITVTVTDDYYAFDKETVVDDVRVEFYSKRTITIPEGYKHAMLVFDGAMSEPTVSINGMQAGYWAYGYNTFRVNITPFIQTGDNLLEVDLQNVEESSRWYPGAGIYRPVKLVLTKYGWIDPWKTYIRTRELSANLAVLDVNVGIGSALDGGLKFDVEICDATGKVVASGSSDDLNNEGIAQMAITVNQPQLWSPESPYLYTARIKYSQSGELLDEVTQKFGIRTIKCSKDGGFQLNGVSRKIKGVCLHHDLGPLGAAINKSALIRQIKMMKAMGCDAIRTSHNMPSQMQMDVCDSLGMMGVEFYSR